MNTIRRRLLTVVVAGLLVVSASVALAQDSAVDEQEPNDRQENARTLELGSTVKAEIAGGDIDVFSWQLDQDPASEDEYDAEPARGILSVSEDATGSLTYLVVGQASGYQIINPGESIEVFNTSGLTIIPTGTVSLEVYPVDPSSNVPVQNQTPAEGSYTFTVESVGESQSSDTNTSPDTSSQLPNTLSIRSTGDERVYYNATVSNSVAPGPGADLEGAEQPDTVTSSRVTGSTAQGGVDNFTFAGKLTVLDLEGGPAEVYVNGERVDPAEYQTDTETPTPTPTPTATSTPTATATPSPTPTSTETRTAMQTSTSTTTSTITSSSSDTPRNMTMTNTQTGDSTESNGQIVGGNETDTESSSSDGPGFGVTIAFVALVITSLFVMQRC